MGDDRGASFHGRSDARQSAETFTYSRNPDDFSYTFENFFHPFVGELIEQVNRGSLPALLDPVFHKKLRDPDFFDKFYRRDSPVAAPALEIDVGGGPYSNYNWELLFHVPLSIAVHLSNNQRFAEAQRWFHYIFDPTSTDTTEPGPARYWRFLRFREDEDVQNITDLVTLLSTPDGDLDDDARLQAKRKAEEGLGSLRRFPFEPHRVAATRSVAYQYHVVMKYLDNLIAWGDTLFREDTAESVNEATQRYVLAANILGPRPEVLPSKSDRAVRSFNDLRGELQEIGNVLVRLETQFPFDPTPSPSSPPATSGPAGQHQWVARTPYFCVPRNKRLLAYWDRVEDRLFKIRNSMSLEGVARQLALFEPAIDPGLLVKAVAAGIDVTATSDWRSPMGAVRAPTLIRLAQDMCNDVRNLGNTLLGVMEKHDAEAIGLLRSRHELQVQARARDVRFLSWRQAQSATDALVRSREPVLERFKFYLRLLGLQAGDAAAQQFNYDALALVRPSQPGDGTYLTEANFDTAYQAMVGLFEHSYPVQTYPTLKLAEGGSPTTQAGARSSGKLMLTISEDKELNEHLPESRDLNRDSSVAETVAGVLRMLPSISVDLHFWGLGLHSEVFGGSMMSDISRIAGGVIRTEASWEQEQAGMASRTASYERRAEDWMLQSNQAAAELVQLGRQILASVVSEQAAHREYVGSVAAIAESAEVDKMLGEKATNQELYAWMQGELTRHYHDHYRFALDLARKAELTVKRELMQPELDSVEFVRADYWNPGRRGLLAGEGLSLDLRRLELAYAESRRREYELVRHVSVNQLDPLALVRLRETGTCEISVPESLFDLDGPGHYLRRIKKVAVSIPAVTGPYTSVSCSLSLVRSSVRTQPTGDAYARSANDSRFTDYSGSIETIVTSSGRDDDGLFDGAPEDRPLPFEGAGAVGTWRIELPDKYRQFDYDTIADVVLHIQYTAREGGPRLRRLAVQALDDVVESGGPGMARLFSLRLEFPTDWARFVAQQDGRAALTFTLRDDHYPYWLRDSRVRATKATLIATGSGSADVQVHATATGDEHDILRADGTVGDLLRCDLTTLDVPDATGTYTLHVEAGAITDLWLLLTVQGSA